MKNFFKPEDFQGTYGHYQKELHEEYCRIANKKLNELIESWPVVYGYGETPMASSLWNMNGPERERGPHTHKARLAFIEKLIKEPCKHEPDFQKTFGTDGSCYCKHCGVELIPEWKAK